MSRSTQRETGIAAPPPVFSIEAAEQAGISKRQKDTALRVASIPEDEFEEMVDRGALCMGRIFFHEDLANKTKNTPGWVKDSQFFSDCQRPPNTRTAFSILPLARPCRPPAVVAQMVEQSLR